MSSTVASEEVRREKKITFGTFEYMQASGIESKFHKNKDLLTIPDTRNLQNPIFRADANIALDAAGGQVTEKEIHVSVRKGHHARALVYQPQQMPSGSSPLVILNS